MQNYKKGTTVYFDNPIHNVKLDDNVIHMHVKSGSKVNNLLNYAYKQFENNDINQITWNGSDEALSKVVACVELMKGYYKGYLYQINKIGFKKAEEVWEPTLDGLRKIKVEKQIPSICIILSKKPLDKSESGYQDTDTLNSIFASKPATQNKTKAEQHHQQTTKNYEDEGIYVRKRGNKDQTQQTTNKKKSK